MQKLFWDHIILYLFYINSQFTEVHSADFFSFFRNVSKEFEAFENFDNGFSFFCCSFVYVYIYT